MSYLRWRRFLIAGAVVGFLCSRLLAGPTAFDMEIGKTTESEVRANYTFRRAEVSRNSGGNIYKIDTSEIEFDGLKQLDVTFDKKGVLVSLMAIFPKSKFDDLNDVLRKKYTSIEEDIPFVGTKSSWYRHEDATIHLEAAHLEWFTSLMYMDNDYKKVIRKKREAEEAKKKEQESSLL